jgi:myo-inositol-1(or 4)-monophosphatase
MYQRGVPSYWPMIAYIENGKIQFSAIFLPETWDMYYADENGAYRNNEKIHVSWTSPLKSAIINGSTNMIRRCMKDDDDKYLNFLRNIGKHINLYSCALGLCSCASGGTDGEIFFPPHDKWGIWDVIPGGFLIQQAGGKVTNFWSDSWDIFNPNVIFSNGHIHAEFQKLLEL